MTESVERIDVPAQPPRASTRHRPGRHDRRQGRRGGLPHRSRPREGHGAALDHWAPCGDRSTPAAPRGAARSASAAGGVDCSSVQAHDGTGEVVPIDDAAALARHEAGRSREWARPAAVVPGIAPRPTPSRRGQVGPEPGRGVGVHDRTGPMLAAIGFDVRAPVLSRRKATPSLRLFAEAQTGHDRRRPPAQQRHAGRSCSTTSS